MNPGESVVYSAFNRTPPVLSYQYSAYVLGCVLPVSKDAISVVDNNYIHIEANVRNDLLGHPIYFCPFISPINIALLGLGVQQNFLAENPVELGVFIYKSLINGFFVRLFVDSYYIPDRWTYNKIHRIHDVLVIGANRAATLFTLIGYCVDRRYRTSECDLGSLARGYLSVSSRLGKSGFLSFKPAIQPAYEIDCARIKRYLHMFLMSDVAPVSEVGALRNMIAKPVAGISVYDHCMSYIESLGESRRLDLRLFAVLFEHATTMQARQKRLALITGKNIKLNFSVNAVATANHLKRLALVGETNRDSATIRCMIDLCRRLKVESSRAAEEAYNAL